jgi:hypothetical protein
MSGGQNAKSHRASHRLQRTLQAGHRRAMGDGRKIDTNPTRAGKMSDPRNQLFDIDGLDVAQHLRPVDNRGRPAVAKATAGRGVAES